MSTGRQRQGTIYLRKDGRWEGAAYLTTANGKTRRIRIYGKTSKDVNEKLTLRIADAKRGIPIPDKVWTVNSYFDHFMRDIAPKTLRQSTIEQYEYKLNRYIRPLLGPRPIASLTVVGLQHVMDEQLENGMSPSIALKVKTVLMAGLTQAMREDIVMRNVARLVKLKPYERKSITPWTDAEVRCFLAAASRERLYPAYLMVALYGLRLGEVLGIRHSDIDWSEGTIHLRQQLIQLRHGAATGPLKTKHSRRDLPLLAPVRQAILLYEEETEQLGIQPADNEDLLFRDEDGLPVNRRRFADRQLHRLTEEAGIRYVTLHGLRHSAATLLKNLGVPDKDIQLILGHSKVSTTQNIYQHADVTVQLRGLSNLERLLMGVHGRDISRQVQPSKSLIDTNTASSQSVESEIGSQNAVYVVSFSRLSQDRFLTPVFCQIRARTNTYIFGALAVKIAVKSRYGHGSQLILLPWIALRDAIQREPSRYLQILHPEPSQPPTDRTHYDEKNDQDSEVKSAA